VQLVNTGGDASAAPQRIFQIDRTTVFLEQIAKRFIGQFLKILNLVAAQQAQLLPSLFVDLDTFPRHGPSFFVRPRNEDYSNFHILIAYYAEQHDKIRDHFRLCLSETSTLERNIDQQFMLGVPGVICLQLINLI
jgi:hypothetical protein